jgi:hypothetical protein
MIITKQIFLFIYLFILLPNKIITLVSYVLLHISSVLATQVPKGILVIDHSNPFMKIRMELFCQTFSKMAPAPPEKPFHQRSQSRFLEEPEPCQINPYWRLSVVNASPSS